VSCLLAKGLTAVEDRTSGYFGVQAALLDGVELSPIGYKIGLECIVKATHFPHYTWTEIPYTFVDRKRGRSKLGPGELIDYLRHLKALYKHMLITVLVQAKIGTIKT
jgi:dolichol-phosphate mannosyltransferase